MQAQVCTDFVLLYCLRKETMGTYIRLHAEGSETSGAPELSTHVQRVCMCRVGNPVPGASSGGGGFILFTPLPTPSGPPSDLCSSAPEFFLLTAL